MPEICEVNLTAQYLSTKIGSSITKITIESGRYLKNPIKNIDKLEFPLKIINIDTKGKFMWFELEHKTKIFYMLNTFGLTGKWFLNNAENSRIKFKLNDGDVMYFGDVRNFGTLEITNDKKILQKKLNTLAPDFLKSNMSLNDFKLRINNFKNKSHKIVIVLMSQDNKNGIGSGLGNYLVPEILYRAKLSPHRTISSLSTSDMIKLYNTIRYVLKLAYVTNKTEYISHLSNFLKNHKKQLIKYLDDVNIKKEQFEFLVYRRNTDNLGNKIIGEHILSGRTTYWCPTIQH